MPDATFKDLCFDVNDVARATAFWAPVLGLRPDPERPRLDGHRPEQTVWLNVVPEPHTVKNRVHPDVFGTVEAVQQRGARVQRRFPGWTIVLDPEGNEFCVFDRDDPPEERFYELAVDAVDAAAIAGWWADRLGTTARHDPAEGPWWTVQTDPMPYAMVFDTVPEPKTVKNRVHWDVWAEAADLVDAGATVLRAPDEEIVWTVLADPEGNEFCAFTRD